MPSPEKIRVLHLIGSLTAGGAERNLYYLGPHFKTSAFHHSICCMMSRGELADELESAGVEIHELGYRRRHFLRTVLRLAHILRKHNIAVLHTHLFEPGLLGRLAGWLAGTPVIVTHEHGKTLWKKPYHRLFERLALWRTDMRIVVSEDIRELRKRREGTPDSKLALIENAVDPERFPVGDDRRRAARRDLGIDECFVVGTVGRLVPAKAYDLFLEAAHELVESNTRMMFLLVGDGPLRADLEARARELGLQGRVLFPGKRSDIPELLSAMDIYLMTSVREGLPISLVEAMLAARPIVSTAVGGIPEVLAWPGVGVLVESGDRQGIVKAIADLMADPAGREAMGRSARELALERYSPDTVIAKLDSLYANLLKSKGMQIPAPGQGCK